MHRGIYTSCLFDLCCFILCERQFQFKENGYTVDTRYYVESVNCHKFLMNCYALCNIWVSSLFYKQQCSILSVNVMRWNMMCKYKDLISYVLFAIFKMRVADYHYTFISQIISNWNNSTLLIRFHWCGKLNRCICSELCHGDLKLIRQINKDITLSKNTTRMQAIRP